MGEDQMGSGCCSNTKGFRSWGLGRQNKKTSTMTEVEQCEPSMTIWNEQLLKRDHIASPHITLETKSTYMLVLVSLSYYKLEQIIFSSWSIILIHLPPINKKKGWISQYVKSRWGCLFLVTIDLGDFDGPFGWFFVGILCVYMVC